MNPVVDTERDPAHKIATQHRLIESLLAGLRAAVAGGDAARAARSLAGLQRAFRAHFLLEEQHYFPLTREANPGVEPELQRLVEEHRAMLSAIERISGQLEEGAHDGASRALGSLESTLHRHEKAELLLLATPEAHPN